MNDYRQFYNGPKGENYVISEIFSNSQELLNDLMREDNSPNPIGSLVMISYGDIPGNSQYNINLALDNEKNYNGSIFIKELKNAIDIIEDKDFKGNKHGTSDQYWCYSFLTSFLGGNGRSLIFKNNFEVDLTSSTPSYQIEDVNQTISTQIEQFNDEVAYAKFKYILDDGPIDISGLDNGDSYNLNFILYKNYDTDISEKIIISYIFIRNNVPYNNSNFKSCFTFSKISGTFSSLKGISEGSIYDVENNQMLIGSNLEQINKQNSFVFGQGLVREENQIVFGKHNIRDTNAILIFGDGDSSETPHNLLTIDAEGYIKVDGQMSKLEERVKILEETNRKFNFPSTPEGKFLMDDGSWQYPTEGSMRVKCLLLHGTFVEPKQVTNGQISELKFDKISLYHAGLKVTIEYEKQADNKWKLLQKDTENVVAIEAGNENGYTVVPIEITDRGTWEITFSQNYNEQEIFAITNTYTVTTLYNQNELEEHAVFLPSVNPEFENNSWDIIVNACESHVPQFTNYWNAGDYKTIYPNTLNSVSNNPTVTATTSEDYWCQDIVGWVMIIAKNHDQIVTNFNEETSKALNNRESFQNASWLEESNKEKFVLIDKNTNYYPSTTEEDMTLISNAGNFTDFKNSKTNIAFETALCTFIFLPNITAPFKYTNKISGTTYGRTGYLRLEGLDPVKPIYKIEGKEYRPNKQKYYDFATLPYILSNSGVYSSAIEGQRAQFINGHDYLDYLGLPMMPINEYNKTRIESRMMGTTLWEYYNILSLPKDKYQSYYHGKNRIIKAQFRDYPIFKHDSKACSKNIYPLIKTELIDRIKPVAKTSIGDFTIGNEPTNLVTSLHYFYLPALSEIVGTEKAKLSTWDSEAEAQTNEQFTFFANNYPITQNQITIIPNKKEPYQDKTCTFYINKTRSVNAKGDELQVDPNYDSGKQGQIHYPCFCF